MNSLDIILLIGILLIIGGAVAYIIKAKKSGKACIGCPHAGTCGRSSSACSCQGTPREDADEEKKKDE